MNITETTTTDTLDECDPQLRSMVDSIVSEINAIDDAGKVVRAFGTFTTEPTSEEVRGVASEAIDWDENGGEVVDLIMDLGAELIEDEGSVSNAWLTRAYELTITAHKSYGNQRHYETDTVVLLLAGGGPTIRATYGNGGSGGVEVTGYWGGDEYTARAWSEDLGDALTELMEEEDRHLAL